MTEIEERILENQMAILGELIRHSSAISLQMAYNETCELLVQEIKKQEGEQDGN
jgi:hypothetical protein